MTQPPTSPAIAPSPGQPAQRARRHRSTAILYWLTGFVLLVAVVWVAARHLTEEREFARLLEHSRPWWLLAAAAAQVATYATAAEAWRVPLRDRGERPSLRSLMELALLKLTADQAVPTGGVSGIVVVAQRLRRMGVERDAAAATLVLAAIGFYLAYAVAVFGALAILWLHHDLNAVVASVATLFGVIAATVPLALAWLLGRRRWRPPRWLRRVPWVESMLAETEGTTPLITIDWRLTARSGAASLCTFALDASTLAFALLAVGTRADPLSCFAALVMGQVAATLGIVPGGLGTFEAVAVATLHQVEVPIASALSAVLLLRGFTFWLPMVPGLILMRRLRAE